MKMHRRDFLRLAGLSAVVAAGCDGPLKGLTAKGPRGSATFPAERALNARRWAMSIDMGRLSGPTMDRMIAACHRVHNVPDLADPRHEIKWLWTDSFEHAFPGTAPEYLPAGVAERPYLLLCNHCANPPCVRVCPTKATFKREDGIVAMDFHRCIGCRFCMAGCPYGSRSFNFWDPRPYLPEVNMRYPTRTTGVVEKCDFCAERLAEGLRPLCVEESGGALAFGDLENPESDVRRVLASKYTIRRKPQIGTDPSVFYVIG